MRNHRRRLEALEGIVPQPDRLERTAVVMATGLSASLAEMSLRDGISSEEIVDPAALLPRIRETIAQGLEGLAGDSARKMSLARLVIHGG